MAFSQEQLRNAQIITAVGQQMGMSTRDIQTAIMAALVESGLRNLHYGDRDSLGLFQQRPSQGWGTPEQVTDPSYAAQAFFRALSRVGNRDQMSMGQAAQAVQRSAFPDRYDQRAGEAAQVLHAIGADAGGPSQVVGQPIDQGQVLASALDKLQGSEQQGSAPGVETPLSPGAGDTASDAAGAQSTAESTSGVGATSEPLDLGLSFDPEDLGGISFKQLMAEAGHTTGLRSGVINVAKQFLGTPYVWGGTTPDGFDCSGFVQYVLGQMGVKVPRLAYQQARDGQLTSVNNIQPGDLVFWGNDQRTQGNHIALYIGNGQVIEAPKPGLSVRIRTLGDGEDVHGVRLSY